MTFVYIYIYIHNLTYIHTYIYIDIYIYTHYNVYIYICTSYVYRFVVYMLIFIRLYATYMESLRPFRSFATVVCQMMGEDLYDLSPEVLLVVSGIFQRQLFVVGVPCGYPELGAKVYSILSDAAMKKVVDGASPKRWVIPHGPMSHKCAMGAENGAFRWPIFTGT